MMMVKVMMVIVMMMAMTYCCDGDKVMLLMMMNLRPWSNASVALFLASRFQVLCSNDFITAVHVCPEKSSKTRQY